MRLTGPMASALKRIRNRPEGVETDGFNVKTLEALERKGLVRFEFVTVTTKKGRNLGARRMVFPVVKAPAPRQSDTYGKHITLRAGAWLQEGPQWDSRCVQRIHRRVELIGEWGTFGYAIPLGGRVMYTGDTSVIDCDDFPGLRRFTTAEAMEANTNVVTCRHCGEWLNDGDDGYGTEHGHCGCEDKSED